MYAGGWADRKSQDIKGLLTSRGASIRPRVLVFAFRGLSEVIMGPRLRLQAHQWIVCSGLAALATWMSSLMDFCISCIPAFHAFMQSSGEKQQESRIPEPRRETPFLCSVPPVPSIGL